MTAPDRELVLQRLTDLAIQMQSATERVRRDFNWSTAGCDSCGQLRPCVHLTLLELRITDGADWINVCGICIAVGMSVLATRIEGPPPPERGEND